MPRLLLGRDPFEASAAAVAISEATTIAKSTVRAVVLGEDARVLVDTGGSTVMLKVGDPLEGSSITVI
ncbi:MAG: hypothetical protein ACYDGM_10240, partial [Vulcanimicrobiaceae bacterium]